MKKRLYLTFASMFYIGFIPGAPGTYASFATTILFFLVGHFSAGIRPSIHLGTVCLITLAGILASTAITRSTGQEDPSFIVIDEVAGQLVTFLFLPLNLMNLVLGFLAFRVFDIWKPFPIRRLESLGGGLGVMADDLLAGVYGNVILQLLNVVF